MLDLPHYVQAVAAEAASSKAGRKVGGPHLELDHAPYVLYAVKYIDLVFLGGGR